MSRYFQCSKDKALKTTGDTPTTEEVSANNRRMRELTKDQYDHEVIQREHIENAGDAPSGTVLMTELKI